MNTRLWLTALVTLALVVGCGDAEQQKAKYLERGKTYFAEENFEKARVEFKNVLQIDPKDIKARYMLAQIQEQKQNFRAAFKNYARVIEQDPAHIEARIRLGRLYLLSDEPKGAMEAADAVLVLQPDNPDALALRDGVLLRQGDSAGVLVTGEAALEIDLGHVAAVSLRRRSPRLTVPPPPLLHTACRVPPAADPRGAPSPRSRAYRAPPASPPSFA